MRHGVEPVARRKTNYSFPRTFGAVQPPSFPEDYNCDAGLGAPDQNKDGFPEGCTGYTQSELCQDEDQVRYKPAFTYKQTLLIGGLPDGQPCNMYDSLKSTIVYGVQRDTETTDQEAYTHKRGQYYQIERTNGLDWFDAIRSALWVNRGGRRSVSVATPWYPEFNFPIAGVVNTPDTTHGFDVFPGHNYKICGWKTIGAIPLLIVKPWCGANYGDHGFAYFSRETVNKILKVDGAAAFTLAAWDGTPSTVRYSILYTLQVLVSLYYRKLFGR